MSQQFGGNFGPAGGFGYGGDQGSPFSPEFAPQARQARIVVKKFLITETGTYQDQYRRPYVAQSTPHALSVIDERIHSKVEKITPDTFGGITNEFLTLQTQPEKNTAIVNGWNNKRLRFMLELEIVTAVGLVITEVLTGFSESFGLSYLNFGGHAQLDDKMPFYINSVLQVTTTQAATAVGVREYVNVTENTQIVADNNFDNMYQDGQKFRMRPSDVFATMTLNALSDAGSVYDSRTSISQQPMKSRRSNALPTEYAAHMLETYRIAQMQSEGFGQSEEQILGRARNTVVEVTAGDDALMKAISALRHGPITNWFTLNELLMVDPNALNPMHFKVMSALEAVRQAPATNFQGFTLSNDRSDGREWYSSDYTTHAAAIIAQAVPAMVADLALTKVGIHTTNMVAQGFAPQMSLYGQRPVLTTFSTILSFSDKMQHQAAHAGEVLKQRLEQRLLRDISQNGVVDFDIDMFIDLTGDSVLLISVGGSQKEKYVVPSFCDALMVPVITTDHTRNGNIAKDFHKIFGAVLGSNDEVDAQGHQLFGRI